MDLNMASWQIIQLIFICAGAGLCYNDLYYVQPQTELLMYRHRNKIVYKRLNAEGCTALGQMKKLSIPADTKIRLEMEKRFYEELIQILIACRRDANQVSTTPPSLATPDPITTIPPTTSTFAPITSTPAAATSTLAHTTSISVQTTTSTIRLSTTADGTVTCSLGYFFNPVSSTCIRVVADREDWVTAKANCEASGEHLAVFETPESVQWIYNLLRNMTDQEYTNTIWIGMRASNGTWRWQGRSNDIVDAELWNKLYPDEPQYSNGDHCGCVAIISQGVGLFDCWRGASIYYMCERIHVQ